MRMPRNKLVIAVLSLQAVHVAAWIPPLAFTRVKYAAQRHSKQCLQMASSDESSEISFDSLMDMDVVLFSRNQDDTRLELGAIQEDGTLAPLSAWSEDAAFGNSVEFLVDEEDRFPGLEEKDIQIRQLLSEDVVSYGSRQVGGGKGPGNPHGEESELLYYVDKSVLENYSKDQLNIVIKPELEILW